MADTVFVTWAFAATGAGTNKRTMPNRLADVQNVRDFGATGNGSTNDSGAIQDAITYCMSTTGGKAAGGTVFFPPGTYRCVSRFTVGGTTDAPVQLVGTGCDNCRLNGENTSGYLISKNGQTFDNIQRIEGLFVAGGGSGAIQVTGTGSGSTTLTRGIVSIQGVVAGGVIGIEATQAQCSISDTRVSTSTNFAADTATPGPPVGTIGYAVGTCVMRDCRATNFEIGYALSGNGSVVISCSAEVNTTGMRVGWGPAGTEVASFGASVQNLQTERCSTGIYVYNATGGYFAANYFTGGAGTPVEAVISNMVWNAGGGTPFVTVTTVNPHLLGAAPIVLQLSTPPDTNPSGYIPTGQSQTGFIVATKTGTSTFTYPGVPSNPGTFVASKWNYPLQYAIRVRKAYECVFSGNVLAFSASVASVDLSASGGEHRNNILQGQPAPFGYLLPAAGNLAGWKFMNTTGTAHTIQAGSVATPNGQMVFANLPGESGVFVSVRSEGMEYDITDGNSSAFDATQTGSGSGHYRVRYNGTNWKRIG